MVATFMNKVNAEFYPDRMNLYVPAMSYAAEVRESGIYRVSLGTPPLAVATDIISAQSTAAAGNTDLTYEMTTCPYGRCLEIDCSGANTDVLTITGYDYLGQKITEEITFNGTTSVVGVKAFKRVTNVAWLIQAGETFDLGTHDKLGLPYKTTHFVGEVLAGVEQSTGTLVVGIGTDPQIATTVDPRGTYNPTGTLNGTSELVVTMLADDYVNASNNGGLHGIAHYSA